MAVPEHGDGPFVRQRPSSISAIGAAWVRALIRHSSTSPAAPACGPSSVLLARIRPSVTIRKVPSMSGSLGAPVSDSRRAAPAIIPWSGVPPALAAKPGASIRTVSPFAEIGDDEGVGHRKPLEGREREVVPDAAGQREPDLE